MYLGHLELEVFAVVVWGVEGVLCPRKKFMRTFFVLGSFCIEGMKEYTSYFRDSGESLGVCGCGWVGVMFVL